MLLELEGQALSSLPPCQQVSYGNCAALCKAFWTLLGCLVLFSVYLRTVAIEVRGRTEVVIIDEVGAAFQTPHLTVF